MDIFSYFSAFLAFLPAWFEVLVGSLIVLMMIIAIFKVIAFVMDVLPFI